MIVWSRPAVAPSGTPYCAVVDRAGRSAVTACRGRWETNERDAIRWEAPEGEACGGCRREIALAKLREMAAKPLPVSALGVPEAIDDDETPDKIVVDVDDASDPTWVGEGPRLARERLGRRR